MELSWLTTASLVAVFLVGTPVAGATEELVVAPSIPVPVFVPVSIDQAVEVALDRNLDLIAKRFDVDLASAQIVTAGLRANPALSLGADYQDLLGSHFQNDPASGAGPPEFNARLDYPFDIAGKRRKRLAVARADRSISELLLLNAVRELSFQVRSACIDVLRTAAVLELGRRQLETLESVVAINEVRVRDGDLAESELMRTRLAARQVAGAIRLSELDLAKARTSLGLLLGTAAGAPPVDVEGPIPSDRMELDLEGLRAEAAAERPDLRALEQARGRADADVSLQRAMAVTDLGVGLQYHRQTAYAKGDSLGFFLNGTLPVFDRNQGEIRRARVTMRQVEAQIAAFRSAVDADVATAVATYHAARDRLNVFEGGALDEAQEVREASEYAYRRGEASFLEFLDAQRAFIETARSYYETLADHARARFGIDYVTGRQVQP
jgi:cobalt-zinc-cadmium efflux system outer membrane protein